MVDFIDGEAVPKLNIINVEDIETYLKKFCELDPLLERLLISAVLNILKKNPDSVEQVNVLPPDPPAWLVNKWHDTDAVWHQFNPKKDIRLAGRVFSAVNWLLLAIENGVEWLQNIDDRGRPKKLLKISSFEHLETIIEKDTDQISVKKRDAVEKYFNKKNLKDNFKTVMTFDNGYYIVKLKTQRALEMEGTYLEHCMGDGNYDYMLGGNMVEFFSLRNRNDLPCVSLCIEKQDVVSQLTQASGRRNAYPKEKYIPYIATFCAERAIYMSAAFSFTEGFTSLPNT